MSYTRLECRTRDSTGRSRFCCLLHDDWRIRMTMTTSWAWGSPLGASCGWVGGWVGAKMTAYPTSTMNALVLDKECFPNKHELICVNTRKGVLALTTICFLRPMDRFDWTVSAKDMINKPLSFLMNFHR